MCLFIQCNFHALILLADDSEGEEAEFRSGRTCPSDVRLDRWRRSQCVVKARLHVESEPLCAEGLLVYGAMMDRVPAKQKAAIAMFTFTHEPCLGTRLEVEKTRLSSAKLSTLITSLELRITECHDMKKGEVQVFRIC